MFHTHINYLFPYLIFYSVMSLLLGNNAVDDTVFDVLVELILNVNILAIWEPYIWHVNQHCSYIFSRYKTFVLAQVEHLKYEKVKFKLFRPAQISESTKERLEVDDFQNLSIVLPQKFIYSVTPHALKQIKIDTTYWNGTKPHKHISIDALILRSLCQVFKQLVD